MVDTSLEDNSVDPAEVGGKPRVADMMLEDMMLVGNSEDKQLTAEDTEVGDILLKSEGMMDKGEVEESLLEDTMVEVLSIGELEVPVYSHMVELMELLNEHGSLLAY